MYTDLNLLLASSEVLPNGGAAPGGLNATAVTLALDVGGSNALGDVLISDLATSLLELAVNVTTAFTSGTDNASVEWRLVSLPIALSLLTNATTSGKRTHVAAAVTATGSPGTITIAGHGLAIGTPVYLSALATTTGPSINTVYYVIPLTANTFALATSFANALAGTGVAFATGAGTCTVEFIPYVHATTGPILRPFLAAGNRFVARVSPFSDGPNSKTAVPTGQTARQAYGVGPTNAPTAQRYLALQCVPSATITAGAFSANLVANANTGRRYQPSALEIR